MNELVCVVVIAVLLNLVGPLVVKSMATPEEINPPNGVEKLSIKSQFMHLMVRNQRVPVTSSIVIAILIVVSVHLCKCCNV